MYHHDGKHYVLHRQSCEAPKQWAPTSPLSLARCHSPAVTRQALSYDVRAWQFRTGPGTRGCTVVVGGARVQLEGTVWLRGVRLMLWDPRRGGRHRAAVQCQGHPCHTPVASQEDGDPVQT